MKERLDILVHNKGLAPSRERAKALIMAGVVLVDGEREDKPGTKFDEQCNITLKSNPIPYVSRGGLKLEKAVASFGLDLNDKVCMDIGASTGGFTDCMLQNGAGHVYSIDVGYGQFDWGLRNDERVTCMERCNFRHLKKGDLPQLCDFAGCDVSFISLGKILPPAFELLKDDGEMVCLIKPQFEAGREKVGKKGVVRDAATHIEVIENVLGLSAQTGFYVCGLDFSPIRGPEGNIEYLLYLKKTDSRFLANVREVVDGAHNSFSNNSIE